MKQRNNYQKNYPIIPNDPLPNGVYTEIVFYIEHSVFLDWMNEFNTATWDNWFVFSVRLVDKNKGVLRIVIQNYPLFIDPEENQDLEVY